MAQEEDDFSSGDQGSQVWQKGIAKFSPIPRLLKLHVCYFNFVVMNPRAGWERAASGVGSRVAGAAEAARKVAGDGRSAVAPTRHQTQATNGRSSARGAESPSGAA